MSQRNQYGKLTPTYTLNNKVFFIILRKAYTLFYKKKKLDVNTSFIFSVFYILKIVLEARSCTGVHVLMILELE